jgi:hypothetical protein
MSQLLERKTMKLKMLIGLAIAMTFACGWRRLANELSLSAKNRRVEAGHFRF